MNLSKIILGCEQIGYLDHGYVNKKVLENVYLNSIKFGINTFDTASIYNLGKSEINLKKIFKKNINKVNIITKGGLNYKFLKKNKKRAIVYSDFSEEFLRNNIKESCNRLNIKRIPLFLIHYPPKDKKTIINVCRYLETFKKENLILNYGFSNIDYKLFNYAYSKFKIFAVENSLNLFNYKRQIKNFKNIHPDVKKIAHSVLAQGFLSGKYTSEKIFPKSDRRHRMDFFSKKNLSKNYQKILKLKVIADKLGTSIPVLSIGFILQSNYVDSIIIGVKNENQFNQNLSSLNFKINKNSVRQILKIF